MSRLLIISGTYPNIRCGVAKHVDIIARLSAEDRTFDVHVLTSDDPKIDRELPRGYNLHPLVKVWRFGAIDAIIAEIEKLRPDVVHIQNPTLYYRSWHAELMSRLVPRLKKRRPGLRIVVMQHDIAIGHPWLRWRYRPLLQSAHAVLVSNQRDYLAVIDQNIPEDKIYLAPVTSHFTMPRPTQQARQTARAALNLTADVPVIAYFGFIHPGRNLKTLIKAMGRLHPDYPNLVGLMIGGPAPRSQGYLRSCQKLADRLGLQNNLIWTGYAPEEQIINGLMGADVFVSLPERGADLRNTSIITGMLAGLSVVTSENPRYYRDPDLPAYGCRTTAPNDDAAVAKAIKEALKNPLSPEFIQKRYDYFDPDAVWNRHVVESLRACRNLPPSPPRKVMPKAADNASSASYQ